LGDVITHRHVSSPKRWIDVSCLLGGVESYGGNFDKELGRQGQDVAGALHGLALDGIDCQKLESVLETVLVADDGAQLDRV
jgi:hypothetical protein